MKWVTFLGGILLCAIAWGQHRIDVDPYAEALREELAMKKQIELVRRDSRIAKDLGNLTIDLEIRLGASVALPSADNFWDTVDRNRGFRLIQRYASALRENGRDLKYVRFENCLFGRVVRVSYGVVRICLHHNGFNYADFDPERYQKIVAF